MVQIGKPAPAWCTTAYHDGEEVDLSSEQFAGRWHVLYFYPLDFTFICPTEIRGFQALLDDFKSEETEVIGVSTDSFFSHERWFADRKTFSQEITHPVIADTSHAVSRAFGVLKEDQGVAYRASVIVDDRGIVRSIAVNDLDAGRSPAEVLRTLQALRSGGLCGADWQRGDAFAA
jgi:peroxiredoxin (alkyl hydroperoxide reductase subunit C)